MAISVSIPKEITEYKEKIIFNLSLRELVCFIIASVLGAVSYFFCTQILKFSLEIAGYIVILLSAPILAVGFIRKDKVPFEKYITQLISYKFSQKQFWYEFQIQPQTEYERNQNDVQNISKSQTTELPSYYNFFKQSQSRKRKQALHTIRNAKKDYKKAIKNSIHKKHT